MGIVRVKKDAKYFSASNEPFNDKRLSWETRGMMGFLLSKPNNWQIRMDALEKAGPAGNHKIRRMLAEARKYGYMNRVRLTLEKGKFDWITEVYESPSLNPNPSASYRKSTSGSSTSGKVPDIVITDVEKTDLKDITGDQPETPMTEPTQSEVRRMEYDLVAMQFNQNTKPYFDEFFRLTDLLPSGKKALGEWKDACGAMWSAKLDIADMEAALTALLQTPNFSVKNPGSLQTTMQTIKMRREKNVKPIEKESNYAKSKGFIRKVVETVYSAADLEIAEKIRAERGLS